ncbi:SWC4 [Candida pseudojiufengensis]|uniref:SWC4 n=1 Tax=Candida pseudojiufengensis TaxID=497109 RepID=UPI002224F3CC|nr:SWC4 [Candida pseudojiufengensis]KAI5963478.1 SWC4 [Candida pseudojiufengensis]
MSADDVLDVLNIQRDDLQPAKKKIKVAPASDAKPLTGMARELYNLVGPNTPPVQLTTSTTSREKKAFKPSPWSHITFKPSKNGLELRHWVKGSESLLNTEEELSKPYFFDKFNVNVDIPNFVEKEVYDRYITEIEEEEEAKRQKKVEELKEIQTENKEESEKKQSEKTSGEKTQSENAKKEKTQEGNDKGKDKDKDEERDKEKEKDVVEDGNNDEKENRNSWTYEETKSLFELCRNFELKWPIIHDRFPGKRTQEELKQHFYKFSSKILSNEEQKNQTLIDSLNSYSKDREVDRKQYLENLLLRTPAEIAEEESLVIEARRFELAAKKMLMERSNLLALLDSPQSTQNVAQYQSSQGIANLYNNLMIYDKHQKKKKQQVIQDPVPPPIPPAASSSNKRDRGFQTQLQQYLSSLLKQNYHSAASIRQEANSIHQLLQKKLTQKEEEAYGLHYHGVEKLTPGVALRSQQRLPGLQQRQSVLKLVSSLLQELDVPTAGGTSMKPIMPTRRTMSKYDELLRSVVTLLDVKKARDKLEAEIGLIKSQHEQQ